MKKIMFALVLLLSTLILVSAQEAIVQEIAGKVEYKVQGKDWRPARTGDVLLKGTMVSTGFKSTVNLKIGNAIVTVKPVTRMSLEELVKTSGGTQTQLYLIAGKIKADVTPVAGQKTEFKVQSTVATASVRGTSFEFDGTNLLVLRGVVELRNPEMQLRNVTAGEFSYVSDEGQVNAPVLVSLDSGLENIAELTQVSETELNPLPSVVQQNIDIPSVFSGTVIITIE